MMCFDRLLTKTSTVFAGRHSSAFRRLAMALVLSAGFADASAQAQDTTSASSFFEPFDKLDNNFWYISDGWSNGAHQNCTWSSSMISVADGMASLTLSKSAVDEKLLCGELQSKQRYGFGTYEARVKAATGSGLNSAFFSYIGPTDQEKHDEIDFEVIGKDINAVQVNQYVKAKGGNEKMIPLATPADQDFSVFAFVWEPSRLRFFVNGVLVKDVADPALVPTIRQKIFFSLWGTDTLVDWMGPFSYAGPVKMQIDWVAFTKAGEKCLFAASLTCDPAITVSASAQPQGNL
jgi:endo-1,3-1,4-beta-glycanase ExoK